MLFLRTFGGLSLENDGRTIGGAAAQRARLAVLAVLAVAGDSAVSRDRLLTLFWPESDADRARGALNQALYALRRSVGEQKLTLGTGDLRLNPEVIASDAADFERAVSGGDFAAAVALYGGPFLDGIHVKGLPEFDHWCERARERFARSYASVLERLARESRDRGELDATVNWMRRLATADPLSSRVARSLMDALVAAGDPEAAIRHGAAHAALLRTELGVDPEPAVIELTTMLRSRRAVALHAPHAVRRTEATVDETTGNEHPIRDRRLRAAVVSGATIGVVALASIAVASRWSAPRELRTGPLTQITIGQTAEIDPAISPDGKFVAFAASRRGERRVGTNIMRIYVQQTAGGRAVPITEDSTTDQRAPAWSPDGLRIAFSSPAGIFVVPAFGGTPEQLVADEGRSVSLGSWSHDGKRLAYTDTQGVWIRDMERGSTHLVTAAGFGVHSPVWSSNDATLSYVVGTGGVANIAPNSLWLVPVAGGAPVRVSDGVHLNTSPAFTPDGENLLYVSNRDGARDIYQQRLRGGTTPLGAPVRLTVGANAAGISLTADGTHLVYAAETMQANIWVASISPSPERSAASLRQLTAGDQDVECVSVSRDGAWLVYDSNKSGNQDIYKMPPAGGDAVQLTTDPADDFCGTMSPDGHEIAFHSVRQGGNRHVFTMLSDGSRQQAAFDSDSLGQQWAPDWSPDANQIAFTSANTGARRIRIAARLPTERSGRWEVRREITAPPVKAVAWSHNGRFLASVSDSGIVLFPAAGGDARVLVPPAQIGDPRSCAVAWGPDSSILYYRTTNPHGDAAFWALPLTGGEPRLLLRLKLPTYASRHVAFATDGRHLFFTLAADEASLRLLGLERGSR
jgi:Tol biopolymer transport system component/DNA-binding SARP family transcriptional activator